MLVGLSQMTRVSPVKASICASDNLRDPPLPLLQVQPRWLRDLLSLNESIGAGPACPDGLISLQDE